MKIGYKLRNAAIKELETYATEKLNIPLNLCECSWAAENLVHRAWDNFAGHQKRKSRRNEALMSPLPDIEIEDNK